MSTNRQPVDDSDDILELDPRAYDGLLLLQVMGAQRAAKMRLRRVARKHPAGIPLGEALREVDAVAQEVYTFAHNTVDLEAELEEVCAPEGGLRITVAAQKPPRLLLRQHVGDGDCEGYDFGLAATIPDSSLLVTLDDTAYLVTAADIVEAVVAAHIAHKRKLA